MTKLAPCPRCHGPARHVNPSGTLVACLCSTRIPLAEWFNWVADHQVCTDCPDRKYIRQTYGLKFCSCDRLVRQQELF